MRAVSRIVPLLIAAALALPAAAQSQTIDVDIAAQPLESALRQLAERHQLQIVFVPADVKGLRTSGVKGRLTPGEAVARLTEGTSLVHTFNGRDTIVVKSNANAQGGAQANPTLLAQAQNEKDRAGASESQPKQLIVVTGSRIPRREGDEASPLVVLTAEDIRRTGSSTLGEMLNYLPQASVAFDGGRSLSFLSATPVQLRGLRAGSTLVLIDGRRAQPSPYSGAGFDLSTVPLGLVERIEVLSDSASAIYGADAIAGVVNVILRTAVDGVQVDARYDDTSRFEAPSGRLAALAGFGAGRLSGFVAVDYWDRSRLGGDARERTANNDYTRFGGTSFRTTCPGLANVFSTTTANLPGLSATSAGVPSGITGRNLTRSDFLATAGKLNTCDFGQYSSLIPEAQRGGFLGKVEYRHGESLTVFGNLLASRIDQTNTGVPPVVFAVVPATHLFNPFGVPVRVGYGVIDLGTRQENQKTDSVRGVLGVRGALGANWKWEAGLLGTIEKTALREPLGEINVTAFTALLSNSDPARTVNVFREGPGAAPLDLLMGTVIPNVSDWKIRSRQADAYTSGAIFRLPGGDARIAFGGEFRNEHLDQTTGTGGSIVAERDVSGAFAELSLPVLGERSSLPFARRLLVTIAGRHDDYSDFGSTTNPKYGLLWAPATFLDVRATSSRSFRAPTLANLYAPRTTLAVGLIDPRRNRELYTIPVTRGGSPDLDPEKGKAWNAGVTLRIPQVPGFSISVDAWRIEQSARIITTPFQTILDFESLFADRITRGAPTPQDAAAGLPGRVTAMDGSTVNFGAAEVEGTDLRVQFTHGVPFGQLRYLFLATYVSHFMAAIRPGAPLQDRLGRAFIDGFAPRVKAAGTVTWAKGSHAATLGIRYIHDYLDYDFARQLKATTLFDLQASTMLRTRLAGEIGLTIGVRNLFDKEPPFSNMSFGYDAQQYDIIGRTVYVALSARF